MFERISHIGVVVREIDAALRIWRDRLGFKQFAEARFEVEGIRSVFLSLSGKPGGMSIELMEPLDKTDMRNAVARRLATKGEGFYHLALVTEDVAASGGVLRQQSFPVIDRPPAGTATQGRWLIHPKAANGIMIEGIEEWSEGRPACTGRLDGRVALVTGAGRGIGRAIVLKLAWEGARVLANDLDADALAALQAEVVAGGGICETFPGDVTAKDFGDRAVSACIERLGDLDILVNNAGYVWNSRIANHTDEQWYAMIDVHATGPFRLLRAAGRHFRQAAKDGRSAHTRKVVNVSSVSGLFGEATQLSYSAAKSALVGMTRSLAKDWGRYNVTVNCVAFGFIETRLTQAYEAEVPEIDVAGRTVRVGLDVAQIESMKQLIPLGRVGTPDEAAGAVYLFCVPESDYISGEVTVAAGGLRM